MVNWIKQFKEDFAVHIPTCPTCETDILTFSEALEASLRPSAEYEQENWLYVQYINSAGSIGTGYVSSNYITKHSIN